MSDDNIITILHCWSAPRSRSTAFLYSFEARGDDTIVMDEPLYREWLLYHEGKQGLERPYKMALFEGTFDFDGVPKDSWAKEQASFVERLKENILTLERKQKGGVIFVKHMAKFDVVFDFYAHRSDNGVIHKHILLIRDPLAVLFSWKRSGSVHGNAPSLEEVGILPMLNIFSKVQHGNTNVVVLDSDRLVADPEMVLKQLCDDVNIDFRKEMLTWKPGPHACDGPWAKWWYASVHASTGWELRKQSQTKEQHDDDSWMTSTKKYPTLDPALLPTLRASLPAYEALYRQSCTSNVNRNSNVLAYISTTPGTPGRLIPREMVGISPWDDDDMDYKSDSRNNHMAEEYLQVMDGKIVERLDCCFSRLFQRLPREVTKRHTRSDIMEGIIRTLAANGMRDGVRLRLGLTSRGGGSYESTLLLQEKSTMFLVLAEWKEAKGLVTTPTNDEYEGFPLPPFQDYQR